MHLILISVCYPLGVKKPLRRHATHKSNVPNSMPITPNIQHGQASPYNTAVPMSFQPETEKKEKKSSKVFGPKLLKEKEKEKTRLEHAAILNQTNDCVLPKSYDIYDTIQNKEHGTGLMLVRSDREPWSRRSSQARPYSLPGLSIEPRPLSAYYYTVHAYASVSTMYCTHLYTSLYTVY